MYIHAATDAHKKVLDLLGLELKVVVIQVMQMLQIKSGPRQEQYACFTSESFLQPWISAAFWEAIMLILILRNPPCINYIHTKYYKIQQTEGKTVFLVGTGKLRGRGACPPSFGCLVMPVLSNLCGFAQIVSSTGTVLHQPLTFSFCLATSTYTFLRASFQFPSPGCFHTVSKAFCGWRFISLVSPKGFRFFEK